MDSTRILDYEACQGGF